MKNILIIYKPFLVFLLKFFVTYVVLGFIYLTYLNQYDTSNNEPDGITELVTNQTVKTIKFFGYESLAKPHESEASFKVIINNNYVARVVEGCNAISVIILFITFVVAFKGRFKTTLFFILFGVLLIYFLNIIRIALICIAMLHYPQHQHLLHGVLFPIFIYGVVFVLWLVWVNNFSIYATKAT